jgi:hypothetical protein
VQLSIQVGFSEDKVEKNMARQERRRQWMLHGCPFDGVEGDKTETVDEQYDRLHLESALPIAIDNGEEMIVASFGGKHDGGHPFPEHVTLLHRDAYGNETFGTYEFVVCRDINPCVNRSDPQNECRGPQGGFPHRP